MRWRWICLWLPVCLVLQANPSEAYACNAELYAEAGGLTGRHLFHPGYASEEWPEFDDPRLKKVGFPNSKCIWLAGQFLDTGSPFVIITLLGGWTSKEGLWQTRLARHLADTLDLSLLAIDVTGRGESCGVEEVPGFSQGVNDLAAAVHYVNSMEGRYAAAVLGHSWGGVQSFMYAARVANVPVVYVADPAQIKGVSDWRWKEFQKQGLVQDPAHPVSAKLVNWRLTREGFEEISAVDLRKEAISIPEETHLYWLSAQDRLRLEIDELNDTGAFNHIPAYQSIELKGENHHFVNNVSNFFSVMEATMRKELAQAEFLKDFIGKAGPTQQYSCPAKTQTGSIHRRLSGTVMPNRLFFGPHFPSDGAQGLVKPAAIYDPDRGWLTTVVHMTSFADLCSTQLCRTWQRAVVGYLGPTGLALPQPPNVKGAVAFEFEPSSFSQTIENLHAAKHGGISFTSYRPFVFQREPHVAYAMAIYDTSLNLTVDSPNSHKQRIEVTGIARMNIRSKQLLSVYDFKEPLVPRRERLSCDTNWGFLELPPAVDMPPQLHILYTILPCLTVFTFNASASTGADFRSARCLTSVHSTLVQQETGLDMQNVRISGHPIVTRRQSDGQPSELMVLVHHSWRKHGGAAHWAVTVDPKTWQVTEVSLKPVLTYESFHLYNEFVNNSIAVGSYHLEGKTLRILFGDGDKYASWEDVDTATIQFLSLDHADGSPAIFTNDYTLGDMLYGATSQAQYQAKSAWRRAN